MAKDKANRVNSSSQIREWGLHRVFFRRVVFQSSNDYTEVVLRTGAKQFTSCYVCYSG